jgi:glutathione synthase/RimK-type ligase-like ATP-grasp enzyme
VVSVEQLPSRGRIAFGSDQALVDIESELVDVLCSVGIWLWHTRAPSAPDGDPATSQYVRQEWELAVLGLAAQTPRANWINHPSASRWIESNKLEQLRLASDLGLLVPPTLLSNDPEHIINFARRWDSVAVKSQGGIRRERRDGFFETTFTQRCTAAELATAAASLGRAPVLVQPYLTKSHELRVTVVDQTVFACRIDSQASPRTDVDWRRYDFDRVAHDVTELDQSTHQKVVGLVEHAGLRYAAIDLVCTPEGETYFLDLNPSGQFLWIEQLTGAPISSSLADGLLRTHGS